MFSNFFKSLGIGWLLHLIYVFIATSSTGYIFIVTILQTQWVKVVVESIGKLIWVAAVYSLLVVISVGVKKLIKRFDKRIVLELAEVEETE